MNKEKLVELFVECYENCELASKIAIHNAYIREISCSCENEIERNDEDFFNTFFEGKPMEAVRASFYGNYRYVDDYVWFNAYGNLTSGDNEDELPLRDAEEMAEWYIEHYEDVDYITEMVDFCNACEEEGNEEEENEEEESED